jgi:hypothetical protein
MDGDLKLFNRVKIDIDDAFYQMLVAFNRGRMVAIFPECTFTTFPLIEFLASSAGHELNCPWNAFPIANII